jgi:hypothetical protein
LKVREPHATACGDDKSTLKGNIGLYCTFKFKIYPMQENPAASSGIIRLRKSRFAIS